MKLFILNVIIASILTCQSAFAQKDYTYQLDSIYTCDNESMLKSEFQYTDHGLLKEETTYEQKEGLWRPSERKTYTYDDDGRLSERNEYLHTASGFDDEWIAECTYKYTYNQKGRLSAIEYKPNEPDYRFNFPYTQVYEYNADGQLIHISETGVTAENTKRKTADITFEYNQSGLQTCMTHIKHHQDRDEEYMKVERAYDKSGNLTTLRLLMFGKPVGIKTYGYDGQRRLTHYSQASGNGKSSINHTLYYDNSNNIIADYTDKQATSYMYDLNINKKEVCGLDDYLSRYNDYDFKYTGLEQWSNSAVLCRFEPAPTTRRPQTDKKTRYYISQRH